MGQKLSVSLWIVPATSAVLAVVLSKLLVWVDRKIPQTKSGWYLFEGNADSARDMLSTISSALMAFIGVVFSITILVLQLASSQFSPRVLRTFLEDGFTRFAMSGMVGSFVFAIALLPQVRSATPDYPEFVPALAVFVATVFILFSVLIFVRYIHHMAHAIRAVHVIERVADEARRCADGYFPHDEQPDPEPHRAGPQRLVGNEGAAGVIVSVDDGGLMDLATRHALVIDLLPHVGDFVPRGAPLFRIWGECPASNDDVMDLVKLAMERTPQQDPAFGLRQLVDIAERALSPGLNDPTTAVQVLDQLHDLLRTLATRPFPRWGRRDAQGTVRVVIPHLDWNGYVHLAFDEIRQFSGRSVHVMRRLRAILEDLLAIAPADRQPVLREQCELLNVTTSRAFPEKGEHRIANLPDGQNA